MLIIKKILKSKKYYINIRNLLRDKERFGFRNNVEYHERVRARAKALSRLKTADIPKQRRGRKPKPKAEETYEKHYLNKKADLKLKVLLMFKLLI